MARWGFFAYGFLRPLLRRLHAARPFDLIHAHYASPAGVIALLAARWMQVPVLVTVHGADVTYTAKQNALGAAIIRWVFQRADAVVANSQWTATRVIQCGAPPDKVSVSYYGGNGRHPAPAAPKVDEARPLHLLSVSLLEPRKGQAFVLRALRVLRDHGYDLRYTIVGDGPQAPALRALADELGLSDIVSFEGRKEHEEVWPYFAACDIFVLPSWNEAFGVVYIEALSQGKPIVGCQGEGGPEELKGLGECGELVQPQNVDSLVTALKRLLDDPARRRQMGETGKQIVEQHFTWERNAATTFALYQKLVTRAPAPLPQGVLPV